MTRFVIDAHTHVWNRALHPQDWIDPVTMSVIARDFTVDDLAVATARQKVTRFVLVQASNTLSETENLLASSSDSMHGVVGWVDLTATDVDAQLDRLLALPNGAKLRGIRHLAHDEADPNWLLRDEVLDGLATLGRRGIVFDLVVRADQLVASREVVRRSPGTRFVLDHLGKPPIASGELGEWERDFRAIAELPNIVAKVSGLTIEADWSNWTPAEIDRALDVALDAFSPERLMFGSDWPLVQLCGGYRSWLETYFNWSAALAPNEQGRIDAGTARAIYGAEVTAG